MDGGIEAAVKQGRSIFFFAFQWSQIMNPARRGFATFFLTSHSAVGVLTKSAQLLHLVTWTLDLDCSQQNCKHVFP